MICVSIQHREQLNALDSLKFQAVELRFDLIKEPPGEIFPLLDKSWKVVATCRPGVYSEPERLEILLQSIRLGADYIDLELGTPDAIIGEVKDAARQYGSAIIISWHDFNGTPEDMQLREIMDRCYTSGADVAKIACMVNNVQDMLRLISLYELPGRKVVIGMGEMAAIIRIAAPILGAEFTFAALSEGEETAPGQLSVKDLNSIYKILNYS